ncbi:MAG TPA: DNA-processing protein DprA, partial [Chitinophagaceae bacterium]|nr:DNA-processing protein DprA [Chitinophagaceae bacterium]
RMAAIIGTRSNTEYGRQQTEKIVEALAAAKVTIVSGLAYGIDAIAHKSSLKNEIPTIGVLAHGLDQVYPPAHNGMAKEMCRTGGGLLSEFRCGTKPDKHNFPSRNRIVAGMTDATIVIETGEKGGSIITAELANNYNRDVFALPGKVTDHKSAGCNNLIRSNKAALLTEPAQLIELMGWEEKTQKPGRASQRELFIELSPEERIIVDLLKEKETLPIDELNYLSGLSSSGVAGALLNLELQSVVLSLPGKQYRLA